MSIWDQIQHVNAGDVCLVPRNDGTGLFVSGTVVANVTIPQGAAATCDVHVFGYYE